MYLFALFYVSFAIEKLNNMYKFITVWRCSLVFHDIEKVTSVYIHILPTMLFYCERWHHNTHMRTESLSSFDYLCAVGFYLTWQLLYFIKTEVIDTLKLDQDPSYITSLRWLSKDSKNAVARLTKTVMRKIGVFKQDEDFDSTTYKTKIIFMGTQFVYTLITFIPASALFVSDALNLLYIVALFCSSVYYGAGYYCYKGAMIKAASEEAFNKKE